MESVPRGRGDEPIRDVMDVTLFRVFPADAGMNRELDISETLS